MKSTVDSESHTHGPLSWKEARDILRTVLETYLDCPPRKRRAEPTLPINQKDSILAKCIHHDIDLYFGAILSVGLLTLVSLSLPNNTRASSLLSADSSRGIHGASAHLAAAILLVVAALSGLWMVRRYRYLCLNDSEHAMRRDIRMFLRSQPEESEAPLRHASEVDHHGASATAPVQLTAQTEVYQVYRHNGSITSWNKVPSLLLVKGDWIALQIGDVAPAACHSEFVDPTTGRSKLIQLTEGESLVMETFGISPDEATMHIPRGRTTLAADSTDSFLTLCNNMRIFVLDDTPLTSSLNRVDGLPKSSQISRQVLASRQMLFLLSVGLFIVASAIAFTRRQAISGNTMTVFYFPIISALAALPVVGPTFVCFVEILGTSRILSTAHIISRLTSDFDDEPSAHLLVRYVIATCLSRFSLLHSCAHLLCRWNSLFGGVMTRRFNLLRVPPASVHLLEKLGTATAFTLIDDELACEPQSVPQQLLIPSATGLKLLDLCPTHDGESVGESDSETGNIRRHRGKSFDSDSESEDGTSNVTSSIRRKGLLRRRRARSAQVERKDDESAGPEASRFEVQFEDPNWWQYIPTLKCIGLACLLLDEGVADRPPLECESDRNDLTSPRQRGKTSTGAANLALSRLICSERRSKQLISLAECIGFSVTASDFGARGDISSFQERRRFHMLSSRLFKERLLLDAHERSSEQSRWWGLLRPDATSVIVQDRRTNTFQLLTVGDPRVVCSLCNEAWQGEISTILPLGAADRQTIIETTNNWKLADLDVAAFSYSPVPHTLETRLVDNHGTNSYLLDNADSSGTVSKDRGGPNDWTIVGSQVFLGVLGSLVVPRTDIKKLLSVLSTSGIRFVCFSKRNMRRQKELAIQMGIDVAWNCAISLRPLESGENDPHRMVSNYGDWDKNARLPHGVRDVRIHIEEVDNVPLLVSLFTDATKTTTKEMVEIFQQYKDTVISVGLSHLTRNEGIFACADIGIGIDILHEASPWTHVGPQDIEFVQSISSHSCAFRLRGASSVTRIAAIIEKGRVVLEAAITSTIYVVTCCVSFSFYSLFSLCAPQSSLPTVPILGSSLFILLVLPILGLTMAMSEGDDNVMNRVPPKNEQGVAFAKAERTTFYSLFLSKAILPALLPQILHPIVFGELMLRFEADVLGSLCPAAQTWSDVARCDGLRDFVGQTKSSADTIVFAQFALCTLVASTGYVHRYLSVRGHKPWERNVLWLCSVLLAFGLLVVGVVMSSEKGTIAALPWYYFVIASITPPLCLFWVEQCKQREAKLEKRAEKLRRLQFETRLGAWSPR